MKILFNMWRLLIASTFFGICAAVLVPGVFAAPTVQQSTSPCYDLLVSQFKFLPATPRTGEQITASIMVATNTCPSGPLFPASHLRWRKGPGFAWNVIACPANYNYATCIPTVTFSYNKPGWHIFEVQVDSRNEVIETKETNNFFIWPINVIGINPTPTPVP